MTDYSQWAQRKVSRGPQQQAPAPQPPAQAILPPPPAGYAWGVHQGQYILVPLGISPQTAPQAQSPAILAPLQPPVVVSPYGSAPPVPGPAQAFPAHHGAPQVDTCTLVKRGDRDTYAEFLSTIPDIVPPSGYDSMAGRPSPESMAELARVGAELGVSVEMPIAYPSASHQPTRNIGDLKR